MPWPQLVAVAGSQRQKQGNLAEKAAEKKKAHKNWNHLNEEMICIN